LSGYRGCFRDLGGLGKLGVRGQELRLGVYRVARRTYIVKG
jgi:hypothetical protein